MVIDIYGVTFEAPGVTFYLKSPWRCMALEHRLFEAIKGLPLVELEKLPDELRLHIIDPDTINTAIKSVARVLKGWQEEASDAGNGSRMWYWLFEGDSDSQGYDHEGSKASLWCFIRCLVDVGTSGSPANDHIDLEGFGLRLWRADQSEIDDQYTR